MLKIHKNQDGFHHVALLIFVLVFSVISLAGYRVYKKGHEDKVANSTVGVVANKNKVTYDTKASQMIAEGNCEGVGSTTIATPMRMSQVGFISPYGLMVGGHVTPVDHQYYYGLSINSPRDAYDVLAPADGFIVSIMHRGSKENTPLNTANVPSSDEYRIVIAHSCSFMTYVDLVTSLDPSIKSQLIKDYDPIKDAYIYPKIAVKKGQVIGHIGGQSLDYAVWDLSKPLSGFANRTAYDIAEPWKLYTVPPTDYLDPSIKKQVIAKYARTTAPIDGKIDYDQDGKLIGTWFVQGTNGYAGSVGEHKTDYYIGHLSFAPDNLDPKTIVVSTGSYPVLVHDPGPGYPSQFWVKGNSPNPANVTPKTGLVKYELVTIGRYVKANGSEWDNNSLPGSALKAAPGSQVQGVALVQMLEKGKIKVEFFAHKTAGQVSGFDSGAQIYDRGDGAHAGPPTSTAGKQ
jgi:hypothetical protein